MNYTRVLNHDYLVRDNDTGAIINTDKSVFESSKNKMLTEKTIVNLHNDVEILKNELKEIKEILREIAKHGNT